MRKIHLKEIKNRSGGGELRLEKKSSKTIRVMRTSVRVSCEEARENEGKINPRRSRGSGEGQLDGSRDRGKYGTGKS